LDVIRADLPMMRIAQPAERRPGVGAGPSGEERGALGPGRSHGRVDDVGPAGRFGALAVALISVAVVLGAIAVTLAFEWTWAVAILAAWAAGLVQGRLSRRPDRPS
jgi:hypothetical protein